MNQIREIAKTKIQLPHPATQQQQQEEQRLQQLPPHLMRWQLQRRLQRQLQQGQQP